MSTSQIATTDMVSAEPKPARRLVARGFYLLLAINCIVGIALALYASLMTPTTAVVPDPATASAATIVIGIFSFFTILSNVLVTVVSLMLVRNPNRRGRIFQVVFMSTLVMITITGIVFVTILMPAVNMVGIVMVLNVLLHMTAPVAFVFAWAVFGPRPTFNFAMIGKALIIPIVWVGYTLVHGAIIGWYPYPFLNVMHIGYEHALINILGIAIAGALFTAMFLGFGSLARRFGATNDAAPLPTQRTADSKVEAITEDAEVLELPVQENRDRELTNA